MSLISCIRYCIRRSGWAFVVKIGNYTCLKTSYMYPSTAHHAMYNIFPSVCKQIDAIILTHCGVKDFSRDINSSTMG